MIYKISDKPPINKLILFSVQMMLSVFTATVLIAQICGVNVSGALVGAGLSTIVYECITQFKSPMYISNSGAFVTPVIIAMAAGGYSAVAFGGFISFLTYGAFSVIFSKISTDNIYKVLPKVLIGSITVVIGVNLMGFIPGYIGETGNLGIVLAFITALSIALYSHYLKGVWSLLPFLLGTLTGYVCAIPFGLVDFSIFKGIGLFSLPTFAFTLWGSFDITKALSIAVLYIAFTVSAICECLSDHKVLSNIIGVDLYEKPGLSRIFLGEGVANIVASSTGGLGACSYGESIATIGFSKNASIYSTCGAAILMIFMGFVAPIQAFIASIPSCVIGGGTATILYGYIASSGLKTLKDVDLNNQKNLIICASVLSIGISGIVLGGNVFSLSGTALALVVGIILNLILKEK